MEHLKWWFSSRVLLAIFIVGVFATIIIKVSQSNERRHALELEKAVVLATEETARATIGRPAEMGDVYQAGDIIYCLASADTLDRAMGLFYRVIEDPMTARFVVWINDTDGEVGISFLAGKLYLVKNDGDGVYPEIWIPPTTTN